MNMKEQVMGEIMMFVYILASALLYGISLLILLLAKSCFLLDVGVKITAILVSKSCILLKKKFKDSMEKAGNQTVAFRIKAKEALGKNWLKINQIHSILKGWTRDCFNEIQNGVEASLRFHREILSEDRR